MEIKQNTTEVVRSEAAQRLIEKIRAAAAERQNIANADREKIKAAFAGLKIGRIKKEEN
jgi:hypothetical protein